MRKLNLGLSLAVVGATSIGLPALAQVVTLPVPPELPNGSEFRLFCTRWGEIYKVNDNTRTITVPQKNDAFMGHFYKDGNPVTQPLSYPGGGWNGGVRDQIPSPVQGWYSEQVRLAQLSIAHCIEPGMQALVGPIGSNPSISNNIVGITEDGFVTLRTSVPRRGEVALSTDPYALSGQSFLTRDKQFLRVTGLQVTTPFIRVVRSGVNLNIPLRWNAQNMFWLADQPVNPTENFSIMVSPEVQIAPQSTIIVNGVRKVYSNNFASFQAPAVGKHMTW